MTLAIADTYLRSVKASDRAAAAEVLCHTFLDASITSDDRNAAETALTHLSDDRSPKVRAAIASVFAAAKAAPLHIVLHLAKDQAEIAGPLLLRSPLLSDADLVELAATSDGRAQSLIARRAGLSSCVAAAIAAVGSLQACIDLVGNDSAYVGPWCYRRMVERFAADPLFRETVIADPRLPVDCRHRLLASIGETLRDSSLVRAFIGAERAQRITRDACSRSSLTLIDLSKAADHGILVERLRASGELTTALVLRCVAHGKIEFFSHLLASLAGTSQDRVRTMLVSGRDLALGALFDKAGLSILIHAPILQALKVWREVAKGDRIACVRDASRAMLDACEGDVSNRDAEALRALLRTIHGEAVRASTLRAARAA